MIPALTASGVLPPYIGTEPTVLSGMSPYSTTTKEIAERFCATPERVAIFRGFLAMRKQIRALGFQAVQWVDGSFCEACEVLHSRPPSDIDVVTLYLRPAATPDPVAAFNLLVTANLTDRRETKKTFYCDAFYVDVGFSAWRQRKQLTYWYGLFTHQRVTHLWKGLLEVPLDDDADAESYLNSLATKP